MPVSALSGPQYLREGLRLVLSPGLRLFVILPLTVNVLLFFGLIWFAVGQFSGWVDTFMPNLPTWLAFLEYILWPLFVALVVLMVFFTFTMLANILAAPFNGFLAEKVEVVVRGEDAAPPFSWAELLAMLPRTIGRELRKLAYFAPRALALLEGFTTEEALLAFGEHYQAVLANPNGSDHRNIRALMETGLPGVRFDTQPIKRKQ